MDDQHVVFERERTHCGEIAHRVVRDFHDIGVDHKLGHCTDEQGVAVGRGLRRQFSADGAARTGAVVDDDLLAELFAEFWPMTRAIKSTDPPGAQATTKRTGREG